MSDYREQIENRTAIFDHYLQVMVQRRGNERKSDCAITFMEDPPGSAPLDQLIEKKSLSLESVVAQGRGIDSGSSPNLVDTIFRVPDDAISREAAGNSGRGGDRYVQFACMKRTFYMDLPNNTLVLTEARRLLRDRSGFVHLHERRWPFMTFDEWTDLIRRFNPVQKEYLNADTRSAAEDLAYVLYVVWKFPVNWQFYFRAFRFNCDKRRDWEGDGAVVDFRIQSAS